MAQAQQSAGSAAGNAQQTAQDVAAAAGYARAAEQAKNDIDAALTGTLKTANHLSEIAAAGEKAQQKSRDNLGLKSAATMEAQSDIYDRTKGRLAIPGAFGFGRAFLYEDVIRFDAKDDFLAWVRNALPGEYSVAAPTTSSYPTHCLKGCSASGGLMHALRQGNRGAEPNPLLFTALTAPFITPATATGPYPD